MLNSNKIGFAGVWKTENMFDNKEEREEEEIQNELSQSGNEFDFGFENDIIGSHSKFWSKENDQINFVHSSNCLNRYEYYSEADDTELQRLDHSNSLLDTYPKPGNFSMETDGMTLHNAERSQNISLDHKYHSLEDSNVGSENHSAFLNSDIADNVPNSGQKR